jgi:ABC-2 type transport system permease protein
VIDQVGEVLALGLAALRRTTLWWTVGMAGLVVVTLAFWPSLEHSDALSSLEKSAGPLMKAFGAQNLSSAAGYIDGQLYALMLPLLLTAMAVAAVTSLTVGDEAAGRLELLLALPVSRKVVWLGRAGAALVAVLAAAVVTGLVVMACLPIFSLHQVGLGRVAAATLACAVLAAFHGSVGYVVGAAGKPRSMAIGVSVLVAVAGYVASFLFPLAHSLAGFRRISPWYWALGDQPVGHGVHGTHLLVDVAATVVLLAIGTRAVDRRDIHSV